MKTVTNGDLDTLAAAVPSPYGPLTRVGTVASLPTPNSQIRIEFTSNLSVTVSLSAEDLENAPLTLELLKNYHSWTAIVADMKTAISALNTLAVAMSTPHTYDDYVVLQQYIAENFPWVLGTVG